MRQPDINRVERAREHLKAAVTILNSIKWEKVSNMEYEIYKTQVDAVKTFSQMDSVASMGQLSVGMGIITPEEKNLIGQ